VSSPPLSVLEVAMPLPDGTLLATDVTVADDGERHPVLLVRTPYARSSLRAWHDPIELARTGWAVVQQDVRGRWGSGGAFDPLVQELADAPAAVEWCARQPWSNGRVATAGLSYNGFTQWAAALARPKALRAIAPAITTPFARDTWLTEGGAFRLGVWTIWALAMASGGNNASRVSERRAAQALQRWQQIVAHPADLEPVAAAMPAVAGWYRGDEAALARLDLSRKVRSVETAAYHLTGWYDIFCEGALDAYEALASGARDERVRRSQRLVVGPWAHGSLLLQLVGRVDFGRHANGLLRGIPAEQLAFLRAAVEDREVEPGVSVFVMGSNRWLDLDAWPPRAEERTLFLADGGRLIDERPSAAGADRYRHDPADPVPTLGGRHLHWGFPESGPVDQRPVEDRDDVLVYTTAPLRRALTVIGRVRAQLRVESSSPRTDFTVKLVDVHPNGTAINVVDSIRRVDLTPGRPATVEVAAGSTAMTFKRGHRIRIEVASANFPHFDCLGTADQTLHLGGRAGSRVHLPVHESER
jgi:uncharacterized protein